MNQKTWYRPDIDGLRALAIIPVVLFHAGITGFSGGFVGVDIFFVISGYLITSIIYRELRAGNFSLIQFWERRIRRIIPALFVMIMTTLALGYFIILYPVDYIDLGQSAFAQAAFLANLFFLRKNGYFAAPSESMPLLHTWSLSVEEQFYILFPLIMFLVYRYAKKAVLPILVILFFGSLFYCQILLFHPGVGFSIPGVPNVWGGALNTGAAFYLLPTRAFELLIGSIIAVGAYKIKDRNIAEVASLFGLGLILYAITSFNEDTVFPGLFALIPTFGAAAIIIANAHKQTFVGSLLSFPIFVWIGLVSYSLYLWHWPILVFAKYHLNRVELTSLEASILILLSFILAYLSYRFVETPFRTKTLRKNKTSLFAAGFGTIILMGFCGYAIYQKQGLPDRAPEAARAIANATIDFGERRNECFVHSFSKSDDPCLLGAQDPSNIDFVLWGDSHAGALFPMFDQEATAYGQTGVSFIVEGCKPITGVTQNKIIQKCEHVKQLARAYIKANDVKKVVIVARWSSYDGIGINHELVVGSSTLQNADRETKTKYIFSEALTGMLTTLTNEGVDVYIVKQVPKQTSFNVQKMFRAAAKNPEGVELESISYDTYTKNHAFENTLFDQLASEGIAKIIDPSKVLCDDNEMCILMHNGSLLYQDGDHLNKTGALYVAPAFNDFFTASST